MEVMTIIERIPGGELVFASPMYIREVMKAKTPEGLKWLKELKELQARKIWKASVYNK